MAKRDLELNLRAKADTSDLKKLENETAALVTAMQRTTARLRPPMPRRGNWRRRMALTAEEKKADRQCGPDGSRTQPSRGCARTRGTGGHPDRDRRKPVGGGPAAERTGGHPHGQGAKSSLSRHKSDPAGGGGADGGGRGEAGAGTAADVSGGLANGKSEYDIVRARENARKATAQAEAAELRLEKARRSGSNSLVSVVTNIRNPDRWWAIVLATRQLLDFGRAVGTALKDTAATEGAELIVLEDKFNNLAVSIGSSGARRSKRHCRKPHRDDRQRHADAGRVGPDQLRAGPQR